MLSSAISITSVSGETIYNLFAVINSVSICAVAHVNCTDYS